MRILRFLLLALLGQSVLTYGQNVSHNGQNEITLPAIVPNGNEPVIDDVPCEVTTVDYRGDFIYVNGKLKRMLFPGGYVTFRNDWLA